MFDFIFRFQGLVASYQRMFPELEVHVEKELTKYKAYAEQIRPLVKETISYIHRALETGQRVLVEGANAAMLDIDFGNGRCLTRWLINV